MKSIIALSLLLSFNLNAFASEANQEAAVVSEVAPLSLTCVVIPVPAFPENNVTFKIEDNKFSIAESSPDSVSTTLIWDIAPVALFQDLPVCKNYPCTVAELESMGTNPYIGSCEQAGLQILIWEKNIRVNGQYFETTNGTSVHTD